MYASSRSVALYYNGPEKARNEIVWLPTCCMPCVQFREGVCNEIQKPMHAATGKQANTGGRQCGERWHPDDKTTSVKLLRLLFHCVEFVWCRFISFASAPLLFSAPLLPARTPAAASIRVQSGVSRVDEGASSRMSLVINNDTIIH